MPKKPPQDKKTGAQKRKAGFRPLKNPLSINDLIASRPILQRLARALPVQQSWAGWLRQAVPDELAAHIVSVIPRGNELVVFADAAVWSTRLRYALVGLQPQIAARDAAITRTRVRVQMQA